MLLAIDTCEARGGVVVREDGVTLALRTHNDGVDYSEWLLPAVDEALAAAGFCIGEVGVIGVATGPGSFTGLRVGLTTVKAWAEVYGKPVVGVSRLEAMARQRSKHDGFVAAFYNAQRGQLFGALYRSRFGRLARMGDERVISPEQFVEFVSEHVQSEKVSWVSLDLELLSGMEAWKQRVAKGDAVHACGAEVVSAVGALAEERAGRGEFTDPLELDANYVRRSDAEIFWKGTSSGVR
jgi:tRNA threonylcarbamoyladenosine biosynthesis protein TsaB